MSNIHEMKTEILGAIGRSNREQVLNWILNEKGKNSKMHKAFKDLEIEKFVSYLGDSLDMYPSWVQKEKELYYKKFNGIPEEFLKKIFDSFVLEELGEKAPKIPDVWSFARSLDGFDDSWCLYQSVNSSGLFCIDCRTDDIGKSGGERTGIMIADGKERSFRYKCGCEASKSVHGLLGLDDFKTEMSKIIKTNICFELKSSAEVVDA